METNINYSLVGAFVIVLISATVFTVIWLSSGFSLEHYNDYMIYSQESISGLNIDSPVEFNGVNVGSVKQIQLNKTNPQLVEVILSIKSSTPVTQGTVATLTTRGITGITYVSLKDKSTDLRPLVIKRGQRYPIITTGPSLFMRIDTALNQLSTNLKEVTQSIKSVLDSENQQAIKNLLLNSDKVMRTLAENNKRISVILANTEHASSQISPLLAASTSAFRTLEFQTLPQTNQLLASLNTVAQNFSAVTVELKQNPSMLVRGRAQAPLGPGEVR